MSSESPSAVRLVVADDDERVLRGATLVLCAAGFEVDAATTGHEVTELLSKQRYDALVADIRMPGNRQLELLAATQDGSLLPVVLITGHPSLNTALMALRGGVLDYLMKPFHPEELVQRVSRAVQKGRELRAAAEAKVRTGALVEAATRVLESAQGLAAAEWAPKRPWPRPSSPPKPFALPEDLARCLSPRQLEVARLLAMGHPVLEVAEAMGLSINTVRGHIKAIFIRLGVTSQVALLGKLAGHPVRSRARQ